MEMPSVALSHRHRHQWTALVVQDALLILDVFLIKGFFFLSYYFIPKMAFFQSIQSFTICYGMILIVMFLPFACLQKSVRSR